MRLRIVSILALVSLVLPLAAAFADDDPRTTEGEKPEWVLAYIMSYDNNLERCGPIILDGLRKGVNSDEVRVVVLHDDTERDGLKRWTITERGAKSERLDTEDSADEAVVADFLDWTAKNHPAKRYGVIFLNHGGNLDDMCVDDYRGPGKGKGWLSAKKMGPIMRGFREKAPGDVKLLFLQQCGRGSIDNLYNFRESADAVMASQFTVGAPNTYYARTVRALIEKPDVSGVELAETIMKTDAHYTHYVCVDGEELSDLPKKIDPVVDALLDGKPGQPAGLKPCFGGWGRGAETNFDLFTWLNAAADASGLEGSKRRTIDRFEKWVEKDLIVAQRGHPRQQAKTKDVCGLSLYVPVESRVRSKYRDYPLRTESRLGELWDALYPAPERRRRVIR